MTTSRNLTFRALLIGLFLCIAPVTVGAQEVINTFDSAITVAADGTFLVVEEITYDLGPSNRHGIYRIIPLTHPQPASKWYKDRFIAITVSAVERDGEPEPFELLENNNELTIKIGDAAKIISGVHTYTIKYKVDGGLSYYQNENPELYWDATGTKWPTLIQTASVTINDPAGVTLVDRACYQGQEGTSRSCDSISATTSAVTFTASQLMPGDGVTVAQSLNGRIVAENIIETTPRYYIWIPVLVALFFALATWLYQVKTKYKVALPVVAQYEPYPGVLPMFTGVLIDGRLDPRDITAGLLYLAEQGFIKIKKTEKKVLYLFEVDDYEVELLKNLVDAPSFFHTEILELLFQGQSVGARTSLSELKADQRKQRVNAQKLSKLRSAVAKDVEERGFYENLFKIQYVLWFVVAELAMVAILAPKYGERVVFYVVFSTIIFALILGIVYRRRTRLGYEALNHIKGFKDFLLVTGEERFAFHNSPSSNPEKFLEYLPYAVALGVEKEWSEVFKDVTIEQPSWYDGGAAGTFNAASLATNLGAFSSSFASPSGSTGSSGGGSVGGGAGGGGGGSW